ncbi:MAG: Holliday junction resolvase RuvX [Clostridia bacterium]|nr:Holliday junction resolvase RuvX [Clostridia bacterium]
MSEIKGRIMGVDFGDVRTGLSVSDPTGFLASGAGSIRCKDLKTTARLVAEEGKKHDVTLFVVGLPINMNGTEGDRGAHAREFAEELKTVSGLPVELLDERLTTAAAHRIMNLTDTRGKKRKAAVDTLSAEIILQNYLDRRK